MKYSYEGFLQQIATFSSADEIAPGAPVKVSGSGAVAAAAAKDGVAGVCMSYQDGVAAVQLAGFVELPYTGTAPTAGFAKLAADGKGGVSVSTETTAREHLVLTVDTVATTVGFLL